ncbi:MAG TPA: hypothetical protein DDW90_05990 [Cyanobacteria bacterium UBA9971]|nr:hypothetical protein [Cyanobacteria bacterium UBA9971]
MIGLSGVRFSDQSLEKKAQRVNTIATGISAVGIAGSAAAAGAVIKYSQKEGNLLVKASTAVVNLANKAVNPLKDKIALLKDSSSVAYIKSYAKKFNPIMNNITSLKEKILVNKGVQKLVVTGAVAAAVIAEKSKTVLSSVKQHVESLPKPVKIAALAAAGILAVSHVYRSGQISGIFAAPKQES